MKIRVLQVVSGLDYGGIELFLKNMFEHMPFDGLDMSMLVTSPKRGALEDYFESKAKIYHLKDDSTRAARKAGRIGFFKAHANDFDVVHIHTVLTTCFSIAKIAKKYCKAKIIVHSHIADNYSFKVLVKNVLARPLMNAYTDIRLACSRNSADFLFGHGYADDAVVIKNAIDTQKFAFDGAVRDRMRGELGIPSDCFVLGTVGRMSAQKNQVFLIDILAEYKKRIGSIKLVIVGDGAERKNIEARIAELGVGDDVILTGARGDIAELLTSFDCFLLPSKFEGLAISAVEAQASGLKCYLSDTITRDINISGQCEFLPIDDASVWAQKIASCDNTRTDNTQKIIDSGYDISSSAIELFNVYKSCVNA